MNKEEKKAIEKLKELKDLELYFTAQYFSSGKVTLDEEGKATINTILDLIENQQKEIKELKEENTILTSQINSAYDRGFIPKQKIKDKIEDLELERGDEIYFTLKGERIYSKEDFQIEILQELLEEEE